MKLRIVVSTTLGLVLAGLAFLAGCNISKSKGELKIGAILPLTGNISEYGQRVKRGMEIAVEDLRQSGTTVKLVIEDDEGSSQKGVAAAGKLTNIDGIRYIVGAVSSSVTLSILPSTERTRALLFSPAASSPKLSGASPLFLRNWPSDVLEGKVLAQYTAGDLAINRVAIFYVNNDYGLGLQDEFSKTFTAAGKAIVFKETYPLDTRDFRALVAKYRQQFASIGAFYLAGYHKDMALATKQLREGGFRGQILGDADYGIPETVEIAGAAAEGAIYASPWYDAEANDTANKFASRFRALYGKAPSEFEGNGYDAVMLIARTIQQQGDNPELVAKQIRSVKGYPGAGGQLTFTEQGDVVKPIALMKVHDGKFLKISVTEPIRNVEGGSH